MSFLGWRWTYNLLAPPAGEMLIPATPESLQALTSDSSASCGLLGGEQSPLYGCGIFERMKDVLREVDLSQASVSCGRRSPWCSRSCQKNVK